MSSLILLMGFAFFAVLGYIVYTSINLELK